MEDYEGDFEYGCKTMPIVIGIAKTKLVMAGVTALLLLLIGWLQFRQFAGTLLPDEFSTAFYTYTILLLQLPLVYLAYRLLTAKGKSDWRFSSLLVKIIMIAGISYLFFYSSGIHSLLNT